MLNKEFKNGLWCVGYVGGGVCGEWGGRGNAIKEPLMVLK